MPPLDHCFVDQLAEAVRILDVGLDTTASSLEVPYQQAEISNIEQLSAHFQSSSQNDQTCRVMLVVPKAFSPLRLWLMSTDQYARRTRGAPYKSPGPCLMLSSLSMVSIPHFGNFPLVSINVTMILRRPSAFRTPLFAQNPS
jgi:hypothetical protein